MVRLTVLEPRVRGATSKVSCISDKNSALLVDNSLLMRGSAFFVAAGATNVAMNSGVSGVLMLESIVDNRSEARSPNAFIA
jgi:hypothetical protein